MFNKLKRLLKAENNHRLKSVQTNNQLKSKTIISSDLAQNLLTFKKRYHYPDNVDIVIREIYIKSLEKKAAFLFIQSIIDEKLLETHIINPLLTHSTKTKSLEDIISIQSVKQQQNLIDISRDINNGSALLLIDGLAEAYTFNLANFKERAIEKSDNEVTIKGPKEAFTEGAQTNISLIRKKIRSESLIVQSKTISKRAHNDVYIIYDKGLANQKLVQHVFNRLNKLNVDVVQNLSILEQYIEDRPYSIYSSLLYTERPDRAAEFIENGYIVLIMDNSPDCLILPTTFWSFFHTSEDNYLRFINGNFIRMIRLFALFVTIFMSSIYVSVTEYHTELIPTNLLLAIAASREHVPFTPIVEVLMMEFSFELIREAGLRVPSPIGPTIGIVGALILGQAAVEASIVSPIVVIIVALSGLSSFVVGNVSLNFTIRLIRLVFIIAASFFGVFGLIGALMIISFYSTTIKSFGVPYYSPLTPNFKASGDNLFKKMIKNELFRPGYLKPKDSQKKSGEN